MPGHGRVDRIYPGYLCILRNTDGSPQICPVLGCHTPCNMVDKEFQAPLHQTLQNSSSHFPTPQSPWNLDSLLEKGYWSESSYSLRSHHSANLRRPNGVPLENVWTALFWTYLSLMKQGPRTSDMRTFRFEWFVVIIREAFRASMGIVKGIPVLRHTV